MSGIWIEMQSRQFVFQPNGIGRYSYRHRIVSEVDGNEFDVAIYKDEETVDRVWAKLENAIASGVRLFRFPTDAELETEDE